MKSQSNRVVITGVENVTEAIGKLSLSYVHFWAPVPKDRRDVYHWLANFEFDENSLSARALSLNVAISDGLPTQISDSDGYQFSTLKVDVRSGNQNVLSTRIAIDFGVRMLHPVKAEDIIKLVTKNKLEYYKFAPEGSGCLWWQTVLLESMVKEKWIADKAPQKFEEKIKTHIVKYNCANRLLYPPVKGKFYGITEESAAGQKDVLPATVTEQHHDAAHVVGRPPLGVSFFLRHNKLTPGRLGPDAIASQYEQSELSHVD